MMQEFIVALIVAIATWAVVKRYMPQPLRRICRAWIADNTARLGWEWLARKMRSNTPAASSCADGCGNCNGCGPVPGTPDRRDTMTPDALKRTIRR